VTPYNTTCYVWPYFRQISTVSRKCRTHQWQEEIMSRRLTFPALGRRFIKLPKANCFKSICSLKTWTRYLTLSWNPKICYRVHKISPLIFIRCQLNPFHTFIAYSSKIQFNSFLPSNFVCVPPPISSFLFNQRSNVRWRIQIRMFLVV
jgi:hypothetical protein